MSRRPEATLIYNPQAGPADFQDAIERVADLWRGHGWQLYVRPTTYAGHAVELAAQAAQQAHRVVLAAGGDGTMGEVAGGLAGSQTALAPLPTGTGNSFAKELGLPVPGLGRRNNLIRAAAELANGRIQSMDLIRCADGRSWLLWAGTGLDGYLVEQIEPRSKLAKRLGPLGYVSEGLPVVARFPGMQAQVTVDGRRFDGRYLMILLSNCRRYAGGEFLLSPDAVLDDGLFEVWLFKGQSMADFLKVLLKVARGRHLNAPGVTVISGRSVQIETTPTLPYHRDGDPAGQTPLSCHIEPGVVPVLVPAATPAGMFIGVGQPLLSEP